MVRDLMYASGSVDTLRGRVLSSWRRTETSLSLEVIVPIGSEADIVIPKFNLRDLVLKEGGKVVWAQKKFVPGVPGILDVQEPDKSSSLTIKVGSGRYVFELTGD